MKKHNYTIELSWTGNNGNGTSGYNSYSRSHNIIAEGKHDKILGSSDPEFLGDPSRYNPEELFLSSLSACHMLWYLHLCAVNKIVVTHYTDKASGIMEEAKDARGKFVSVTLYPVVTITNKDSAERAIAVHAEANSLCYIANSCNFPIAHDPRINWEDRT